VDPPGAEVLVNGVRVGKAPLADVVFVDPGDVVVEARAPGLSLGQESLKAVAGKEEAVTLVLKKEAPPAQGALAPGSDAPRSPGRTGTFWGPQRVAGAVVTSVGAVGAVVGAVLGGIAIQAKNAGFRGTAFKVANGSTAALAVGGVLAATGIVLIATGHESAAPKIGINLRPSGIEVAGTW
jgi:hypothetical protein